MPAFNAEFMQPEQEEGSAFVAWIGGSVDDILCEQYERVVGKESKASAQANIGAADVKARRAGRSHNCVAFEGMKLQIPADRHRMHYVKVRVRVHRYVDGSFGPRRLARYGSDGRLLQPELQAAA